MSLMKNMRSGINSAGMQFVLIAIIVTFVFWGVGGSGNSNTSVASVNGKRITDTKLNVETRLARSYSAGTLNQDDLSALRQRVLQQMIDEELKVQEALSIGLTVSDVEIQVALREYPCQFTLSLGEIVFGPNKPSGSTGLSMGQRCNPWFQDDTGKFQPKLYENQLSRMPGLDDQKFSTRVERQLLVSKLEEMVARSVHVSPVEVEDLYIEQNTRIGLSFVAIDKEAVLASIEISDVDANAFAEASPESIQTAYDAALESRFTQKAVADTSSITLLTNLDDVVLEEVQAELQGIRDELAALEGEALATAFAEKAMAHSDDLSKADGGARGERSADVLETDVSEAIFAVTEGGLTEVVRTNAGFELLLVHSLTQEVVTPIESVRIELATELLKEENLEEKMSGLAAKLLATWKAEGELSVETLESHGLVMQVDPKASLATRSVLGLGPAPKLIAAARNAEAGTILSQSFDIGGAKVLAKVDTIEKATAEGLEEKRSEIEMALVGKAMNDAINGWRADLYRKAKIVNRLQSGTR
jgi:peptidyl-prolyl cis-trans isomerase D